MRNPALLALAVAAALPALPLAAKTVKTPPLRVELKTGDGQPAGTAVLTQKKNGVAVKLSVQNIPDGLHGVHIHAKGVCDAPDFKGAGPHWNPEGKKHGFESAEGHHMGDTPHNLEVGPGHAGMEDFLLKGATLDPSGGADSLTANGGTAIVVHEHADDMKTDPSGNSGNRIACGTIAPQ